MPGERRESGAAEQQACCLDVCDVWAVWVWEIMLWLSRAWVASPVGASALLGCAPPQKVLFSRPQAANQSRTWELGSGG